MKTQEGHGLVFPLRKQKARVQYHHPHKPIFFSIRHCAGFFKSNVWPGKKKDISVRLVVPIGSTCRYPPDPKRQHVAHRAPAPGPAARRRRGGGWRAATETVGAADLWRSLGLGDHRSPKPCRQHTPPSSPALPWCSRGWGDSPHSLLRGTVLPASQSWGPGQKSGIKEALLH